MRPEILAIFVPIVFLLGLFAVIALNIISKYKAKEIIDDLAAFGAPVLLFSGGEPLVRRDLAELAGRDTVRRNSNLQLEFQVRIVDTFVGWRDIFLAARQH